MSNIIIPSAISELPLLDTELLYACPAYLLNPASYDAISASVTEDVLNQIRFGYFAQIGCSHPRFDLDQYFYRMKTNPIFQIFPDKNPKHTDFDIVTDNRALRLKHTADKYDTVYLFWSGGIDSTVALCSMLKNWDHASLSKITMVLNEQSIAENPNMYYSMILDKFNQVSTGDFFSGKIKFNHDTLYITGDGADTMLGYDDIYKFDQIFPGIFNAPWKKHKDSLIDYFSMDGRRSGEFTLEHIIQSLDRAAMHVESVFDFLWWVNFNWGHDIDLYFFLWQYSMFPAELDPRKFMEENVFLFFNSKEYQNWAVSTIGTNLKIGDDINSFKIQSKKYIYDFNRDREYFDTKRKVASVPAYPQRFTNHRLFAIDTSYNLYYVEPSIWLSK